MTVDVRQATNAGTSAREVVEATAHGTMNAMPRVLVIDDEPGMRAMLRRGLEAEGHTVTEAADGATGLAMAVAGDVDLVLLDLGLPALDGETVLAQIVAVRPQLPVIVVSAKDDVDDRVAALDAGAQDYVVKPFALAELMARVRLRARNEPGNYQRDESTATTLSHGRVRLDRLRRVAEVDGDEILLTPQEFALAEQFLTYPEEILTRAELLKRVWGLQQAPRRSNLVDVGVVSLRRRLGADTIETVRGEGYRFLG